MAVAGARADRSGSTPPQKSHFLKSFTVLLVLLVAPLLGVIVAILIDGRPIELPRLLEPPPRALTEEHDASVARPSAAAGAPGHGLPTADPLVAAGPEHSATAEPGVADVTIPPALLAASFGLHEPVSVPTATPKPEVAAASTITVAPAMAAPTTLAQVTPTMQASAAPIGPAETVARFYDRLGRADYEAVVALWSDRMRSIVPLNPEQLRARSTSHELTVTRAELISLDEEADRAVVAVEVLEVVDHISRLQQRYVGTWNLVRGPSGWLLDEPNIRID